MPELPEVETVRRQLEPRLVGRRIVEAGSHWSDKFTPATAATGHHLVGTGRRGKFLLLHLDDERELVVHLGMTGRLQVAEPEELRHPDAEAERADDPYLRAWWQLDDGARLDFHDVRRFGRIRVVPTGDYSSIPALRTAGPEPWDPELDARRFAELLAKSRRRLKTQLLSQRPIAGVGNIYADEALWLARINPRTTRLSTERAGRLLDAIREVLERGLDNGGTTLRDYRDAAGQSGENQHSLAAYGRGGAPCLRCDEVLRSAVIDARTTTWCPVCQRR
ncbi:MAG: bifunctional DNA-formamidopyrimidine glycosylase/DNA-(apurinic or apyrimidinic site) lyase [Actinomycetota bacterium]